MDKKFWIEIASILIPILSAVVGSFLKLRDRVAEVKAESDVSKALLETALDDIKVLNKDIHEIALIIGTTRALAEKEAKEKSENETK